METTVGFIQAVYNDFGEENGNYYLVGFRVWGFRVQSLRFRVESLGLGHL